MSKANKKDTTKQEKKQDKEEKKGQRGHKTTPRFNTFNPLNFLNLSAMWKHRENLRKNLQRAQDRVDDSSLSAAQHSRAVKDVQRIERNLKQLDENRREFLDNIKYLMDLLLIEQRVATESEAVPVLHSVISCLSEPFQNYESNQNQSDSESSTS